jgi:hypothetical protein
VLAFLQDVEYEGVEVLIAGLVLAEGSFFGEILYYSSGDGAHPTRPTRSVLNP